MKNRLAFTAILFVVTACDWIQYGFVNSIPFSSQPSKNPDVHVYLGIDGLSYHSMTEARRRGPFSDPSWKVAKFISMFPATSDASWTRILHTEKLGGYEYQYYDSKRDEVMNPGFKGLLKHIAPTIADSISFEAKYLSAFDFRANGYTHAIGAYHDVFANLAESLDNLFFLLDGRSKTRSVFSAYLLEIDVMGHMNSPEDIQKALGILASRIEAFKKQHPERRFYFTFFSDHGLDFIPVESHRLIEIKKELPKVGVSVVDTLANRARELAVVPIDHTRVTYLSLHTPKEAIEEVAKRSSTLEGIEFSIARMDHPPHPSVSPTSIDWYGIWERGDLALSFAFDPTHNQYELPAQGKYSRFGLTLSFPSSETPRRFSDEDLFNLSAHSPYPDLFYRIRTALKPIGVVDPADILLSFKPAFAALGFTLPGGANDFAMSGFHGSLGQAGSLGTLLTEERDLPRAVRSDNFLELFPKMREHMKQKGLRIVEGDPNALLPYR